jgi:histidyl-tRNA synthetase
MLADAEIVCVVYEVLKRLGFSQMTTSINNRKLLDGIGQSIAVPDRLLAGLYRSIDKLDKLGLEGVRYELLMVGVPAEIIQPLQRTARRALQRKISLDDIAQELAEAQETGAALAAPLRALVDEALQGDIPSGELQAVSAILVNRLAPNIREVYGRQLDLIPEDAITRLLELLEMAGPPAQILDQLAERLKGITRAEEGISELRDLFRYLKALGVPDGVYRLNFAMVRGLEYYTGPIFETTVEKPKAMPSITGGGRYDNLMGMFSPTSYPATGTSLGIERIIDVMDELDMFPPELRSTTTEVLVTIFNEDTVEESLRVAGALRDEGINTTLYFDHSHGLREQIGYASATGIPYAIILGPDEIKAGLATIRRMGATTQDSQQRSVSATEIASTLRNW